MSTRHFVDLAKLALRFMALNDLANDLAKNQLGNQDEQSEAKLTRQVVSLLADKNSEVKNQAVKWQVDHIRLIHCVNPRLVSGS